MKKIALLLLCLPLFLYTRAQMITTVAGHAATGYTGDGGAATAATIHNPNQIALDNVGNLYIVDQCNNVIRKVNTAGVITTFAGDGYLAGSCGGGDFVGDGGAATNARMRAPFSVTVDPSGNVYIGDDNDEIRKVNTSGVINAFVGSGPYTTPGSYLSLYGDGGPATATYIIYPLGLAADGAGNIYFIDGAYGRIRKVNTSGIVTTIAGTGICCGGSGYSGDGGPATAAQLNNPNQVAVDNAGNVYIADAGNTVIRKINTAGIISTIAGNGTVGVAVDGIPATAAQLWQPTGVAVDASGNVYIGDGGSNRIRKVDAAGIITTFAGSGPGGAYVGYSGDYGAATAAWFTGPGCLAVDATGNVYVTDYGNQVIRKIDVHITPITPGAASICPGTIATLTDVATGGTWSTSASAIATVSSGGLVTGVSAGTAIITHTTSSGFKIAAVTVNSTPALSGTLTPPSVCYGEEFAYFPPYTVPGTTSTWSRPVTAGISNPAATDTGFIIETLINDTPLPVTLPYYYILTANGCTAADTVYATIEPEPVLLGPLALPALCDSAYFHYVPASATPGITYNCYEDYTPGIIMSMAASADSIYDRMIDTADTAVVVYFQINLNQAGCPGNVMVITVTVNPAPAPVMGITSVNEGATTTLSDAATGGTWSSSNTSIATVGPVTGIVTGVVPGTDTVYYNTDCPVYTIVTVMPVLALTAQAVTPPGDEINIYPNPAANQLTILSTIQPINQITITNLLGQTVYTQNYNTQNVQVDIADFPTGVYFIKINGSEVRKFVKE